MSQYVVVLFKNKTRKKIVKKFSKGKNAMEFFDRMIKENSQIIFDRQFENGKESKYELALLEKNSERLIPTYLTDEFGRNVKVKLENPEFSILKISPFKHSESIYDIDRKSKVSIEFFLSRYLPKVGVKVLSVLNNKVILQNDDEIRLFSLKSESDAERFVRSLSEYFFKEKRGDCIFVTDTSSPQRKYLFEFLQQKGIDKKILYRKFTTHPRP